jgi:hypothetical protein
MEASRVMGLTDGAPPQSIPDGRYKLARLVHQQELGLCAVMGPDFKFVTRELCAGPAGGGRGLFARKADDFLFGRVHLALSCLAMQI